MRKAYTKECYTIGYNVKVGNHKCGKLPKVADLIPGGKADDKTDADLAKEHDVPKAKIDEQTARGVKVEHEHTPDDAKAREIARDHLSEFPDYYSALDKMEERLKAGKTAAEVPMGAMGALDDVADLAIALWRARQRERAREKGRNQAPDSIERFTKDPDEPHVER
jgi:hypothetical protein